eukprot:gene47596-8842_t
MCPLPQTGERTARQFMELCGEEQWKGRTTALIECYDQMQDIFKPVTEFCREDEDSMMIDFKRIVSIFFTRKYRLALEEAGGPGDDQDDRRTNRMSEVASRSALEQGVAAPATSCGGCGHTTLLETERIVMGQTSRASMPTQLAKIT